MKYRHQRVDQPERITRRFRRGQELPKGFETPGQGGFNSEASASRIDPLPPYILPLKKTARKVRLPQNARYPMLSAPILKGVIKEGDMLGKIPRMKYSDHDLSDRNKFPDLAPEQYLRRVTNVDTAAYVLELQEWARGLKQAGFFNLLEIPHFGRSPQVNSCGRLLLSCVHGGYMWLDRRVPVRSFALLFLLACSFLRECTCGHPVSVSSGASYGLYDLSL